MNLTINLYLYADIGYKKQILILVNHIKLFESINVKVLLKFLYIKIILYFYTIKQIQIMTTITFGTGKEKIQHVIETSKVNEYLISLANAGWNLSEITKITKK